MPSIPPSALSAAACDDAAAFRTLLASLPLAGYLTDALGRLVYYNEAAAALWGRRPRLHDETDLYCGAFRLRTPDGALVPHPDCWAAQALLEGREFLGRPIVVERPDGSRVDGIAHAVPLRDASGRTTGVVGLVLDANEGRGVAAAVNGVAEELSTLSGDGFFAGLVRVLCRACEVDMALVALLDPERPGRARVVAFQDRGAPGPESEYELRGTPCDVALRSDFCSISHGVCRKFPDDPALVELGAEAYVGKLLHSAAGEPVGVLAVLHRERLLHPGLIETLVRVVAVRTGVELESLSARRALAERERFLRLSQAAGRVGSWEYDPATDRLRCSEETFRLLGRPAAEFDGRPETIGDAVHPEHRPRFDAALADVRVGVPPRALELRIARPDGEERLLFVRGEITEATPGRPSRIAGVAADVTEQRREQARRLELERELRRSEERYRNIVEATRAGVVTTDVDGRITFVNARLATLLGVSREELHGGFLIDRVIDPSPDDRRRLTRCCDGVAHERRDGECGGDARLRGRDGAVLFVRYDATPLFDAAGVRTGTLLLLQDETERRRLEEERRKIREGLILNDRLASVGTLAAGVAHEMNNPLAYVLSNLELAREALRRRALDGTPGPAELMPLLDQALEGVERVRATVRGLRTFARADEERRRPVDLRRVLDVAADLAGNEIRHRAILVKEYAPTPLVDADEGRLAQVFVNLLVNAAQAVPDDGTGRRRIRLRLRPEGEDALAEVEDEGCGMGPETLARAFEPFFTTKPVGVGSGLGLSICHGIVTAHGGTIALRSTPGRGTVVRVSLPRARDQRATPSAAREGGAAGAPPGPPAIPDAVAPVAAPRDAEPSAPPARPFVLIVDDDPLVARATERVLARDCETAIAGSGAEALAAAARRPPDVVVCDLMMPEMTGMELHARWATERPELAARMVFMTGGAFTAAARDFLERTPSPRLEKPFLPAELRAIAAEVAARGGRAPAPAHVE